MKRIMSIMLILCMVLTTSFSVVAEEAITTYYVSGNGSDRNSGTEASPFATLDKALQLAEANSTIYIMDDIQVADTTNNDAPLVITKNVTIKGSGTSLPTITLHAGGIVLGADVSFENIKIGTASMLRPGIAANGHILTLTNVQQGTSLQPLQIYGGTFFDATNGTDYGKSVRGTMSDIRINGGSYEAVYAGSINGDGEISVDITVAKGSRLEIGGIYAGSTVKDPNDNSTSGQIPHLEPLLTLQGQINIKVTDNAYVERVDGVADTNNVNLETDGDGQYSFVVANIDSVTVNGGTFAPAQGSDLGVVAQSAQGEQDIVLVGSPTNKATLDLSELTYAGNLVCVEDFTGSENGIFVLPENAKLQVDGTLTGGPTELRVAGGMLWSSAENPGYSGLMEYETTYVNGCRGDGTFVISNPDFNQEDIAFTEDSSAANGWTTISEPESEPPALIDFTPVDKTVSYEDANTTIQGVDIDISTTFDDDEPYPYLYYVPLDYEITYKDEKGNITEYIQQSSICNEDGYYVCNYTASTATSSSEAIMMKLEAMDNTTINICKGDADLPAGIYEIAITALTTSGTVTKSCKLTVLATDTETQVDISTTESSLAYGASLDLSVTVKDDSGNKVTSGKVQLYINDVAYGEPVAIENDNTNEESIGSVTWKGISLNADNGVHIGSNTLKAAYIGADSYADSVSSDIDISVEKTDSKIIYSGNAVNEKVEYDGENHLFVPDNTKIIIKNSNGIQLIKNPILDEHYTVRYTMVTSEEEGNLVDCDVPVQPGEYTVWLQALETDYWSESETIAVGTITIHNHQWQTEWNCNTTHHWHECNTSDCITTQISDMDGYELHHGGNANCVSRAICSDCGEAYGEKNSNKHTGEAVFRNQKEATETENGYTGDVYCLGCNAKIKTGSVIPATGSEQTNNKENTTGNESTENNVEEILQTGTSVFDAESQVMYKVTSVEATGGTVEYEKLHDNKAKKIIIPDVVEIKGVIYKVTSIAKNAFKSNKTLTTVEIGNNVKIIGKEAFSGCKKLKTVNMGNNVTTIGDKAFYNCGRITSITIPSKVNKIGKSAFEKCKNMKMVTIKTKKLASKKVGAKAFKGIKSNATVKVPKKKYKIYKSMLYKKGVSSKAKCKKI